MMSGAASRLNSGPSRRNHGLFRRSSALAILRRCRRDHVRALTQRVEVAEGEARIMGSKSRRLQTLLANGGASAVPTQGLKWRTTPDDDEHYVYAVAL